MKFDVIVGNPPYQIGASGGDSPGASRCRSTSGSSSKAIEMDPRYVLMITPSRWFAGGRRARRVSRRGCSRDRHIRRLVDYPNAVRVLSRESRSRAAFRTSCGTASTKVHVRSRQFAMGSRWGRRQPATSAPTTSSSGTTRVLRSSRRSGPRAPTTRRFPHASHAIQPFGIRTNFRGKPEPRGLADPIGLYGNGGMTYIERHDVPRNDAWVDEWKVLLGSAYGAGEAVPHQITNVPIVAPPGTACTETYLVINRFSNEEEARRFATYLSTRFVRFLISLRKNTQHLYNERFAFVPTSRSIATGPTRTSTSATA